MLVNYITISQFAALRFEPRSRDSKACRLTAAPQCPDIIACMQTHPLVQFITIGFPYIDM